MFFPERSCLNCSETNRNGWGCTSDAPLPPLFKGEELKRCPRRPFLDETYFMTECFRHYSFYKKGIMPYSGGQSRQPAKLMDALEFMDAVIADCQNEQGTRQQAKQEAQQKAAAKVGKPPRRD